MLVYSYVAGEGVELTEHQESVVVEKNKGRGTEISPCAISYDRNYNRIGLHPCTQQTSGEEVKTSVYTKEEK